MSATGAAWDVPNDPSRSPGSRYGRVTSLVALGVDLAMLGLLLAGVHSPWRMGLGLAFCLLVPGSAAVLPLRLNRGELEATLALAMSIAITICLAQLMLWLHQWHPIGLGVVIGLSSIPVLTYRAVRP